MTLYNATMTFGFTGVIQVDVPNEHDARVAVSALEHAVLDEVENWPTTQLHKLSMECSLDDIAPA